MNDFNPIPDALNDIDTQYIIKPKRKKRLIALMIAAAAAAMMLMTGFTVVLASGSPGVNVQIGRHTDHQFSYNITDKKGLNTPTKDELLKMGGVDDGIENSMYSFYFEDALPSDILKLYNAEPITLGNDNFIEQPCKIFVNSLSYNDGQCDYLDFNYQLTHKKSGVILRFSCYVSINDFDPIVTHETDETFDKEIIPLNDGSMCLILEQHIEKTDGSYSKADFSYDGIIYRVISTANNVDKELMKEILSDLGVL